MNTNVSQLQLGAVLVDGHVVCFCFKGKTADGCKSVKVLFKVLFCFFPDCLVMLPAYIGLGGMVFFVNPVFLITRSGDEETSLTCTHNFNTTHELH